MENNTEKAWLVTYPGMEFDEESEVAFGETRNKVKYGFVGAGADARWVDIRVVRAKDLDGLREKWNNDSRFRDLWFLNNGYSIETWTTEDELEHALGQYSSGDYIREALNIPYENDLTYEDIDKYAKLPDEDKYL